MNHKAEKDLPVEEESSPDPSWTPERRWVKMLAEYFSTYNICLPESPGILNIGCGNNVKWNYLAVTAYLAIHDLGIPRYVGVDQNEEALTEARAILGGLADLVVGDARYLTEFLNGTYHLAIFEHPNLSTSPDGPKIWRKIFRETASLLHTGAAVILTSFWLKDHIPAQIALERAGYTIVHSGKNKYPGKKFDTASNGESLEFDKYIAIAKCI